MTKLFNLARMTTATTGTGTVTLGSAVSGHITFASAGAANNDRVSYGIVDGTAAEVGTGTYTSSGTTLSRTLVNSTTGSLLNLSGSAEVFITDLAADHLPDDALSIPGAFGLIKNNSDVPVWARAGVYTDNINWPLAFSNGTGAGANAGLQSRTTVDGFAAILNTGTTITGAGTAHLGSAADYNRPCRDGTLIQTVVRLLTAISDGTNAYRIVFGMTEDNAFTGVGAVAVQFNHDLATFGDANIRAQTRNASTNTLTDTGVALVTDTPYRLAIRYDSASQVRFYIDDVLVATHTTNIPPTSTEYLPISCSIKKTAGTTNRVASFAQTRWSRVF